MQEQNIILDDKSFKALSAESRVSILKALKERRMTLSELAKKIGLESSTIKEHCGLLVNADLITLIDDGHKWKYYELTRKGKSIIMPSLFEQVRVLVVLCLGAVLFGGILSMVLFGTSIGSTTATDVTGLQSSPTLKTTAPATSAPMMATVQNSETSRDTALNANSAQEITREFFIFTTMLALIAGIFIGWISSRKIAY